MMANFDTEFVTELFLDDTVSTINRLIVATANVVNESLENISHFNDFMIKEYSRNIPLPSRSITSVNRERTRFYERVVKNFSDDEYIENLKMCKSTVKVCILK